MQQYLVKLVPDLWSNLTLDEYNALLLDLSAFTINTINNVGPSVIPLIVRAMPNSPFIKSKGIVMLQPRQRLVVEDERLDGEQVKNLSRLTFIRSDITNIIMNQ